MQGKFSDIPYFLISKYFSIIQKYYGQVPALSTSLIGPKTSIVTRGAPVQELFVKDNSFGYRSIWITIDSVNNNEFTVFKNDQSLIPSTTYTELSGQYYNFKIFDLIGKTEVVEGDELYFRKDSPFYEWLLNGASQYFKDQTTYDFIIENYINTNKAFIYFGNIYKKSNIENLYSIQYYGLKDYVVNCIPDHQRTDKLTKFLYYNFDYIFNEIYSLEKNIPSIYDAYEIDQKYLTLMSSVFGVNVDDLDIDNSTKRSFVAELINLVKKKGTFTGLRSIWKLLTKGSDNLINFYEKWHDKNIVGQVPLVSYEEHPWYGYYDISKPIPGSYYDTWSKKYNTLQYPENQDVKCLSTAYKIEIDLTKAPIHKTEIFNKTLADKVFEYWEFFRPINRVSDYNIFVSPLTDLSLRRIPLYSRTEQAFLDSRSYTGNITFPDTHIEYFAVNSNGEYIINHNLNTWTPIIQCYSFELNLINPDSITILDSNRVKIQMRFGGNIFAFIKRSITAAQKLIPGTQAEFPSQYYISDFFKDGEMESPESFRIISQNSYEIIPGNLSLSHSDYSAVFFQPTASSIWSFQQFFGTRFFISLYDSDGKKIQPSSIVSDFSIYTTNVYFDEPTAGYAVLTTVDMLNIFPSVGPVTSLSINHNLDTVNFNIQIFDAANEVIVPDGVEVVDENNINVYLDEPTQIFVLLTPSDVEIALPNTWKIYHNLNVKEIYTQVFNLNYTEEVPDYLELTGINTFTTILETGRVTFDRYTHLHNNPTVSNIWNINHNLGYSGVLVNTYDENNLKIYPKNITLLDENNTIVEFDRDVSGYAVLVGIGSPVFTDILKLTKFRLSNNSNTNTFVAPITEMWNDTDFFYFRLDVPLNTQININKIEILTDLNEVLFDSICSNIYKSSNFTMTIFYRVSIRKL